MTCVAKTWVAVTQVAMTLAGNAVLYLNMYNLPHVQQWHNLWSWFKLFMLYIDASSFVNSVVEDIPLWGKGLPMDDMSFHLFLSCFFGNTFDILWRGICEIIVLCQKMVSLLKGTLSEFNGIGIKADVYLFFPSKKVSSHYLNVCIFTKPFQWCFIPWLNTTHIPNPKHIK